MTSAPTVNTPGGSKTMRTPARPLCMLEVPPFTPPVDDYTELSRFLRISTMPGYSNSDTVSEYKDNHNMAVWDNQKDLEKQMFKMKRDWLSNWGEFNVKEQRWRKAWVEKFGADTKS
ncbi:uncharacterized protein LOC101855265 isoform X2 [Aplysia californica]|uniref:Uncharacterized protein LOC101855265 isoform X2 n=1 Tax=Aplysia californica TaxID=6500 RepID=A0ABM0JSV0_APLCA|nr:uncharacterized protein LOC101855265 isoform X2 [Aplysia californica]